MPRAERSATRVTLATTSSSSRDLAPAADATANHLQQSKFNYSNDVYSDQHIRGVSFVYTVAVVPTQNSDRFLL